MPIAFDHEEMKVTSGQPGAPGARRRRGGRSTRAARAWAFLLWGSVVACGTAAASDQPEPREASEAVRVGGLVIIDPVAARPIWIDGRFVGCTPLTIETLPPGVVQVTAGEPLVGDRWRAPLIVTMPVRPGRNDTLRLGDRGRREFPAPLERSGPLTGESVVVKRNSHLSKARVLLPVAAVVLGIAGVWTREAGDQAYEDYTRTLDRERMRSRLARARDLDRAAVACWIGAEACLVTAAWQWLHGDRGRERMSPLNGEGGPRRSTRPEDARP